MRRAEEQAAQHESNANVVLPDLVRLGCFAGSYAVNPVNQESVPVWVADYVLGSYGSGAIMAVPGHDTRDFDFAQQFQLPIVQVVQSSAETQDQQLPFTGRPPQLCIIILHCSAVWFHLFRPWSSFSLSALRPLKLCSCKLSSTSLAEQPDTAGSRALKRCLGFCGRL